MKVVRNNTGLPQARITGPEKAFFKRSVKNITLPFAVRAAASQYGLDADTAILVCELLKPWLKEERK